MSSVRSFKSQNVTKRVVTTDTAQLFVEADFKQLERTNPAKYVSKLGNSYLIAAGTKLSDVLDGTLANSTATNAPTVDGATPAYTPISGVAVDRFRIAVISVPANTACVDMGKEIRIGYAKEPDALVFRKVRVPPNPTSTAATDLPQQSGTGYTIGYLLVDNKVDSSLGSAALSISATYAGYFNVAAARV
jgi:hypothetical protein